MSPGRTLLAGAGLLVLSGWLPAQDQRPFRIEVVDEDTGRGVPLVELETVHGVLFVTDSAGLCAIDEPGLMGKDVWFHVRSHGYLFPEDGFGYRGFRARLDPGGRKRIALTRANVAERLYRVTGQGIYRDSVLLGRAPPIRAPVLNGGVLGQDSVMNAIYRGRLHWFWGDTNRASYPLGNFATSGATSALPGRGGLDPHVGVDLEYFTDERGFCRKMCPLEGPGVVWIDGVFVVRDGTREHLLCHFARSKGLGPRYEHGIAEWDDAQNRFVKKRALALDADGHAFGHAVEIERGEEGWVYFGDPYPYVRVRARHPDALDASRYESWTCLREGTAWDRDDPQWASSPDRSLWAWRRGTAPTPPPRLARARRRMPEGHAPDAHLPRDVETFAIVMPHRGSVSWNAHLRCWVMLFVQSGGRSPLGETWVAFADTVLGPWVYARRVVTHENYSFYNVKQHPYFASGRHVYFEGTYTAMFSGAKRPTPRYDYNQIMYRLDLDDPRLSLPAPVYKVETPDGPAWLGGGEVTRRGLWSKVRAVPFHASRPGRPGAAPIAIARSGPNLEVGTEGQAIFHALPAEQESENPAVLPLYRWNNPKTGAVDYQVRGIRLADPWKRAERPLVRVWRSPDHHPPLDTR